MKVYIKNMVAQGTRKFVLAEIKRMGLKLRSFESGELDFEDDLSPDEEDALDLSLSKYGLKLIFEEVGPQLHFTMEQNSMDYSHKMILV